MAENQEELKHEIKQSAADVVSALKSSFSELQSGLASMQAELKQDLAKVSRANQQHLASLAAQMDSSSQLLLSLQSRLANSPGHAGDVDSLRDSQQKLHAEVTALGAALKNKLEMVEAQFSAAKSAAERKQATAMEDLLTKLQSGQEQLSAQLTAQLKEFKQEISREFNQLRAAMQSGIKLVCLRAGSSVVLSRSVLTVTCLRGRLWSNCLPACPTSNRTTRSCHRSWSEFMIRAVLAFRSHPLSSRFQSAVSSAVADSARQLSGVAADTAQIKTAVGTLSSGSPTLAKRWLMRALSLLPATPLSAPVSARVCKRWALSFASSSRRQRLRTLTCARCCVRCRASSGSWHRRSAASARTSLSSRH